MNKWIVLLIVGLFLIPLITKRSIWTVLHKKPHPETFFEGKMQVIAKAIKSKDIETITQLGASLDNIDTPGKHNMTLLGFAVNDENPESIKALMALGADPSIYIPELGTVGYLAMWCSHTEPLKALLESGMDPNMKQSNHSRTLLFDTPELAQSDALKLLVKYGADVNARDSQNNTPLLHMLSVSFDEALYLLDHGADGHAITNSGLSVAYSVQVDLQDMDKNSEAYQKMKQIQQKLIAQGVKFPALSPWGERFRNNIVFCQETNSYKPKSECKVEGVNEFVMEQPEILKRQDEHILLERFGIKHRF